MIFLEGIFLMPPCGIFFLNFFFYLALEEAARRFQELKAQRESREALEQERNSRKPPPYKFIKVLTMKFLSSVQINQVL